jgi:DNA polymerase III epsilon subunit-like protein
VAAWGPWLDSRRLAEVAWPDRESYGLGALISTLDLQETLDAIAGEACPANRRRYHCALYDALASALLLRAAAEVEVLRALPLPALLGDEPTEAWW